MFDCNKEDYYNYCLSCGLSEDEAREKNREREIMIKLYFTNPKEPREITSTTYERAQKRLKKEVETVMGLNRR